MEDSSEVHFVRTFSGFSVELKNGSRARQRMSNRVTITVPTDRGQVEVNLTIREAKALQNFLAETLSES